jgi:hypothetical protein
MIGPFHKIVSSNDNGWIHKFHLYILFVQLHFALRFIRLKSCKAEDFEELKNQRYRFQKCISYHLGFGKVTSHKLISYDLRLK